MNTTVRKILIVGDAGRGKTTLAKNFSKETRIPYYQTDDYLWKVKFTIPNDKKKSEEEISEIYKKSEWIIEGTTRRLFRKGIEKADVIYLLEFNSIFYQYYYLIKRFLTRKNERIIDICRLLKHVTYKKFKKGYRNHLPPLREMLEPYNHKVVRLTSLRDINQLFVSKNN